MIISKIFPTLRKPVYKLDEYTAPFGSIIFDGSVGGNISNSYYKRYVKRDRVDESSISFIEFYICKETNQIKHIDFPSLGLFSLTKMGFELPKTNMKQDFTVNISTWVSPYGLKRGMAYDDSKYSHIEEHLDIQIVYDNEMNMAFLFGYREKDLMISDEITFCIDRNNNLSGIILNTSDFVKGLLKKLNECS